MTFFISKEQIGEEDFDPIIKSVILFVTVIQVILRHNLFWTSNRLFRMYEVP